MVAKIRKAGAVTGLLSEDGHRLSVAQWCDRKRWDTLTELEATHVLAHSGPGHHWVTLPPLQHKNWKMPASEWSTATRRRLGIDVIPTERKCGFCLWDRCDTKGNHATMCTGGASCILRHNEIRSILAKAIQDAGFKVGYEHEADNMTTENRAILLHSTGRGQNTFLSTFLLPTHWHRPTDITSFQGVPVIPLSTLKGGREKNTGIWTKTNTYSNPLSWNPPVLWALLRRACARQSVKSEKGKAVPIMQGPIHRKTTALLSTPCKPQSVLPFNDTTHK